MNISITNIWKHKAKLLALKSYDQCRVCHTSQLICRANQLTGFYIMVTLAFNELRQSVSLNFLWIFWFWDKYNEIFKKVEISLFQPQWPKLFEKGRGLFVRSTIVDLGFLMQHVTRKIPKIIYFINLHSSSFNIDMEITHNHEVFADQASFTFTPAEIWNSLDNRFAPNAPFLYPWKHQKMS